MCIHVCLWLGWFPLLSVYLITVHLRFIFWAWPNDWDYDTEIENKNLSALPPRLSNEMEESTGRKRDTLTKYWGPSLLVMEPISVPLTSRQGLIPEHVFLHLSVMFSKRTKRLKEFLPKIIRKLLWWYTRGVLLHLGSTELWGQK